MILPGTRDGSPRPQPRAPVQLGSQPQLRSFTGESRGVERGWSSRALLGASLWIPCEFVQARVDRLDGAGHKEGTQSLGEQRATLAGHQPASSDPTTLIACSTSGLDRYRFVSCLSARSTRFAAHSESSPWLYAYRMTPTEPWTAMLSSFAACRASRSSVSRTPPMSEHRTSAAVSPGSRCRPPAEQ